METEVSKNINLDIEVESNLEVTKAVLLKEDPEKM